MAKDKILFLFFGVFMLCQNTMAEGLSYENCYGAENCGECGTNCHYSVTNGTMTVYGPPEGSSDGAGSIGYRQFFYDENFSKLVVTGNIESIGKQAFYFNRIQSITLNDSVKTLGQHAFGFSNSLTTINFGSGLETIGDAFAYQQVNLTGKLVIPAAVTSLDSPSRMNDLQALYCPSTVTCTDKGVDESKIEIYQLLPNGVYAVVNADGDVLKDGDNKDRYYASPEDMISGTICNNESGECEEQAKAAKIERALNDQSAALLGGGKVCNTMEACRALVDADNNGSIIKMGRKEYASLNDLLAGKSIAKRIYTVQEANDLIKELGGDTFRFSIRYK